MNYFEPDDNKENSKFLIDEDINNLNIMDYLLDYLKTFSRTGYIYSVLNYLSHQENVKLQEAGILTHN